MQLKVAARKLELLKLNQLQAVRWLDDHAPGRAREVLTDGFKI